MFGKSPWNGNYVSQARHYFHDPYSYFRGWRDLGPKWNPVLQQIDRIPNLLKGLGLGAAYGLTGKGLNDANDSVSEGCK